MIEFKQVEPGIYVYCWSDQVDMEDARTSFIALKAINAGKPYAAIVDMQQIKQVPHDIAAMRALIKEEVVEGLCGYVIFGAPTAVLSFIKPMSLLAPTAYKFASDWDTALQMARALLTSD